MARPLRPAAAEHLPLDLTAASLLPSGAYRAVPFPRRDRRLSRGLRSAARTRRPRAHPRRTDRPPRPGLGTADFRGARYASGIPPPRAAHRPPAHAAAYRNADAFRGARAAVAGAGSSAWRSPTTSPKAVPSASGSAREPGRIIAATGGLPGDLPAIALLRLPPRIADAQARLVRRLTIGDLSSYGLAPPAEGIFTRLHREGKAPAIVDREIIQAIRDGRIEITPGLESVDHARPRPHRRNTNRGRHRHRSNRLHVRTGTTRRTPRRARPARPPPPARRESRSTRPALHRLPPQARADQPHEPRSMPSRQGNQQRKPRRHPASRQGGNCANYRPWNPLRRVRRVEGLTQLTCVVMMRSVPVRDDFAGSAQARRGVRALLLSGALPWPVPVFAVS